MNGLTAADFADTGQWRLIIKIFKDGMTAHLENTIRPEIEPQLMFSGNWNPAEEKLRENIENAVYDHPRLLDDFATKIIIYDPNTLFIPTELVEEEEGAEEKYHTTVFPCEASDVMIDTDKDLTATYSMAPGVKSFLYRTFPGCRIHSNLMDKVKRFRNEGEGLRLYVTVRDVEFDLVLLDGESLISASTHKWKELTDVVYHGFNLLNVYELDPMKTQFFIFGKEWPDNLKEFIQSKTKKLTLK